MGNNNNKITFDINSNINNIFEIYLKLLYVITILLLYNILIWYIDEEIIKKAGKLNSNNKVYFSNNGNSWFLAANITRAKRLTNIIKTYLK